MIIIKAGWLLLAFAICVTIFANSGGEGQASLLEAVIYQLTDGLPKSVGRLF